MDGFLFVYIQANSMNIHKLCRMALTGKQAITDIKQKIQNLLYEKIFKKNNNFLDIFYCIVYNEKYFS